MMTTGASDDTIYAISSGAPPAAIGIVRISGPAASSALVELTGRTFEPRLATLARLRDRAGAMLDEALILWFPGPHSATGEDCVELHCHGGRAVLAAVCHALGIMPGLREAEPGEFTRRGFVNGRIDLAQAEGLADLLEAETETQRAAAIINAGGALSLQIAEWRESVLELSARVEAALDFSDEDDVSDLPADFDDKVRKLARDLRRHLERPRSDRLGEGFRVVLAGPPNSGKSTLFNVLVESEAAITSPVAGTTRDVIERAVAIEGIPFVFVDTAGLRDDAGEEIEALGIERARTELARADVVAWLGPEGEGPAGAWEIDAQCDVDDRVVKVAPRFRVSAVSGTNIVKLKHALVETARRQLPKPGELAINRRQHALLSDALAAAEQVDCHADLLLKGEELRRVRAAFDRLTGRTTTEDLLDALFGRFCIGK